MKLFEVGGRYYEHVRLGSMLVLIALTTHAAALLTWQVAGPAPADPAIEGQRLTPGQKAAGGKAVVRVSITPPGLLLFGEVEKTVVTKAPANSDSASHAPKTTLQLELKGVIAFKPEARALAIISEKGGKKEDKIYAIGDKVPGNAEVRGIYKDRVILSRAGKFETLLMTESKDERGSRSSRKTRSRRSGKDVTSLGDGRNWQISNSYWQKKISDIPALAKEVGVEVYKRGGVQQGYRLTSASGGEMLAKLGLQAGDIIYEVNGIKLTNASQGLTAYKKIKNAPRINLIVGKNGRRESRSYKIDKRR